MSPAWPLLVCLLVAGCDDSSTTDHGGPPPDRPQSAQTELVDPNAPPGHSVDARGAAREAAYLLTLAHRLPHLRAGRTVRLGYGYSACALRTEGLPGESFRGSLIRAGLTPEQEAVLVTAAQTRLCPEHRGDRS